MSPICGKNNWSNLGHFFTLHRKPKTPSYPVNTEGFQLSLVGLTNEVPEEGQGHCQGQKTYGSITTRFKDIGHRGNTFFSDLYSCYALS